ncbi:hypothetical protein AL536_13595 [Vibrio fluvialis]|uniref:Uncharacterized protein n=1 Tax=Vibrio fluvialis TaxID=676 RepID=A0AAX2LPB6_VIBFL|nr:hypothetical protein [Vibrio fluvialis]AMF94499.1 hypothetical protein AL536_13595 [Vibrio fluvialis]EKO4008306.1 hypothetical protein [Vibrio fluvialis]MBY8227447.1 hypothetical protein [Vibrio fluvialis]MCE7633009.1 hypothetical protein [Vibrio fluvialis]SUP24453.1 Uncharacterised protein [Vibrio fluvialis]
MQSQTMKGKGMPDVISPLAGIVSAVRFLFHSDSEQHSMTRLNQGFTQMVNGLSLILGASEQILNDKIDSVIDTELSVLTESQLEEFEEFEQLVEMLRPLVLDRESGFPEDFRRSIARVIERAQILKDLERQMRDQETVSPSLTHINSLKGKTEVFMTVPGWKEA